MIWRRVSVLAAPLAALAVALAFAGSASAQSGNPFGCTAGTANASLLGASLLPGATSANPANVPCADGAGTLNLTNVSSVPGLALSLGPVSAKTRPGTSQAAGSTVYTGATSTSTVNALDLGVAGLSVAVTSPSTATVDYQCVNNQLVKVYNSTLNAITINGNTVSLNGLPQNLSIPGVATILVNEHASTATSDTETLLHVQLLGAVAGGLTLDVGQATASQTQSAPCADTNTGGGPGPGGGTTGPGGGTTGPGGGGIDPGSGTGPITSNGPCPAGARLISADQCGIPAGSQGNARTILVPNSTQISGANAVALSLARRLYKSVCLEGAGPNYAIVGNVGNNRITVGKVRERVLALGGNDGVTVKSGNNTCVDGANGNDTVTAGNSPVRVYAGNGNDKVKAGKGRNYVAGGNGNDTIAGGNGTNFVYGGNGNDVIRAGNGRDSLNGNAGNDRLTAGNGPDHLYGNAGADVLSAGTGRSYLFGAAGNDHLTAKGNLAYVNGGGGRNVARVRAANRHFARTHGSRTVHVITG